MLREPEPGRVGPAVAAAPGLAIEVTTVPGTARLTLDGELDLASEQRLRDAVGSLVSEGHVDVAIDMRQVTFCDATGLKTLRSADATLRAAGGRLTVQGPCPPLQTLLDLLPESGLRLAPPPTG